MARSLEGSKVSVAQIYQFAHHLEQVYARAGYVLIRVAVPPQKLKDGGDAKIAVIDGFIEKVEVKAVSENLRAAVSDRFVVGCRYLAEECIEGGNGALEIRNFVAALCALPGSDGEVIAYYPVPEWITGLGFVELHPAAHEQNNRT